VAVDAGELDAPIDITANIDAASKTLRSGFRDQFFLTSVHLLENLTLDTLKY